MAMSIYDISSHDLCCWAHCLEKKLGYYSMNCVRAASSANAQQELAEMGLGADPYYDEDFKELESVDYGD
jgi:hypothetical protein